MPLSSLAELLHKCTVYARCGAITDSERARLKSLLLSGNYESQKIAFRFLDGMEASDLEEDDHLETEPVVRSDQERLRVEKKDLVSLLDVISATDEDSDPEEFLQRIAASAKLLLQSEMAAIFQVDPQQGGLLLRASSDRGEMQASVDVPHHQYVALSRAVATGQAQNIHHRANGGRGPSQAVLCVPIEVTLPSAEEASRGAADTGEEAGGRQGMVVAVLICAGKAAGGAERYSAEDLTVLSSLAQAAGAVLRRLEQQQRMEQEAARGDGLMALLQVLSGQESAEGGGGSEGMRELIGRTVATAAHVLGCQRVELFFVDVTGGREEMYHAASSIGAPPPPDAPDAHVQPPSASARLQQGSGAGQGSPGKRRRQTALAQIAMRVAKEAKEGAPISAAFSRFGCGGGVREYSNSISSSSSRGLGGGGGDGDHWVHELLQQPPLAPSIKSLLCVPVRERAGGASAGQGRAGVMAVLLACNKLDTDASAGLPFTGADCALVQTLAYLIGRILRKNLSEFRDSNRLSGLSDDECTRLQSLLQLYGRRGGGARGSGSFRGGRGVSRVGDGGSDGGGQGGGEISSRWKEHRRRSSVLSLNGSSSSGSPSPERRRSRDSGPVVWSKGRFLNNPSRLGRAVELAKTLQFDCFDYSTDELLELAMGMMRAVGVLDSFLVQPAFLQNFLIHVRSLYRDNPYHNFHHGFQVFQFAYLLLYTHPSLITSLFSPTDLLALCVATLCHDIDHPGNTNSFEVATNSHLALLHSDSAVLERHHAHTTFKLLRKDQVNFLHHKRSTMVEHEFREFRKTVIGAIMATDMAHHGEFVKKLELDAEALRDANIAAGVTVQGPTPALGARGGHRGSVEASSSNAPAACPEHRQLMVNAFTHAGDLSNLSIAKQAADNWCVRVNKEFRAQQQKEALLGIESPPHTLDLDKPEVN